MAEARLRPHRVTRAASARSAPSHANAPSATITRNRASAEISRSRKGRQVSRSCVVGLFPGGAQRFTALM
jgi:hypothetical protein